MPEHRDHGDQRQAAADSTALLLEFTRARWVPCPRCGYDLRDLQTPKCPECGEVLELKVGSPRVRFGWLLLACVPGCFSGIAALFVLVPVYATIASNTPLGRGVPVPIMCADGFGFLSAAAVGIFYRKRHTIMSWPGWKQQSFAMSVWGTHILAFLLVIAAMLWL
jgi:hypothetical protein